VIPAHLLVHTASVEPYEGSGAYGDVYGAPVALPCYFEAERKIVRDAEGDEAVAEATIYADLGDEIKPGSRVTVNGYSSTVITVSVFDDGGLTGLAHREIAIS
jgi:hypothetical protein